MKKELLEELKINADKKVKREKIKKYLTTLEALGLATLIGLTGLTANKILKNKKLLKKIKNGKLLKSIKQRSSIRQLRKAAPKTITNRKFT
ncbi:MAG TPA: hypothetical protein VNW99_08985 [Cytophagaceae bacterium]|jgi:hypothetical protein|nr:hypothetical protein [Cytophagaceae bacterium]